MSYEFNTYNIMQENVTFIYEAEAFSGVMKIADKVRNDISLVFGVEPKRIDTSDNLEGLYRDGLLSSMPVIFGTVGKSTILDELNKENIISLDLVRNKREVYSFSIVNLPYEGNKSAIVIAGSDKRGTIYGLFHISELLKVSPLVDWCDIKPDKLIEAVLDESYNIVSKEPSVRYRGFFINDEWPAFGNWTMKNFGGFNTKMYEHVFELLLRLKGNYMWPAMWTSRFSVDGPDLANAELADELGVVMGMSHHEPCLRHGEEYKYLRGPESKYGDAWNFRTNEEGITKFWEDGLIRSGKFENVITVGMRGECDSTIMGKDATLKDNIDLLRDVLKTQNRLIRENVNENLEEVPRMLALYKEVEPFFYGDETTEGLMDSEELEGVTLMLCDDNFGNLRTLPTDHMRAHKGGYGMYYHFDYHGAPVSFEWVNSSYLPKVWEQMTTAYEFGVRDLWIVNVGDIFTNEYPLSYFMDLAYDYEKWGITNINSPIEYTDYFVDAQFANTFDEASKKVLAQLLRDYTRIAHNRRPEAMNDKIYSPVWYGELEDLSVKIMNLCDTTDKLSAMCDDTNAFTFFQLVGYPLIANLNLQAMWLATTENHYLTKLQATFASKVAAEVKGRLKLDGALVEKLHEAHDGKWYGMGMSEHIGFTNWNEEECQFPVLYDFEPGNKKRFVVQIPYTEQHTEGGFWSKKILVLPDFLDPSVNNAKIMLYTTGKGDAKYEIICHEKWLSFGGVSKGTCVADFYEQIFVSIDRDKLEGSSKGKICIHGEYGDTEIIVPVNNNDYSSLPANTSVWLGDRNNIYNDVKDNPRNDYYPYEYIAIEAAHYAKNNECEAGQFVELPEYGRTLSGMKAFPVDRFFEVTKAPSLDYRFTINEPGIYVAELYIGPSNPVGMEQELKYGIAVAEGDCVGDDNAFTNIKEINAIPEGFKVVDGNEHWESAALNSIRITKSSIYCAEGINTLRVYAITPGFVLEKLVIYKEGDEPPKSYLGPKETYRTI